MRKAYWSLICYPLALACVVMAAVMMHKGSPFQAMGFSVLGIYMLLLQVVWAHLSLAKSVSFGDVFLMLTSLAGAACALVLILTSFSEPASNYLIIGSVLFPVIGRPLAVAFDNGLSCSKKKPD